MGLVIFLPGYNGERGNRMRIKKVINNNILCVIDEG